MSNVLDPPSGRPGRFDDANARPLAQRSFQFARWAWRTLPLDWRRQVGGAVRHLLEPTLAARLPVADPAARKPAVAAEVIGVFRAPLGHTTAARLLCAELRAAGVQVREVDVTRAVGAEIDPDAAPLQQDPIPADAPVIVALNPMTMLVALGGMEQHLRGRRVIGYWVWELEQAPPRWALLRHAVHEIWAPSAFAAEALQRLFDLPTRVVPHPVALQPPPARSAERSRGRASIGAGADAFVALCSFAATSSLQRKNPMGALAAFEAAFGARRDALLVLRCVGAARYPSAVRALAALVAQSRANVRLILEPKGLEELHDLYAAADVYLSLHRSEGFGLNLAEAALSGLPVIATAWSGNIAFQSEQCAALVPAGLIGVHDPQRIYVMPQAHWADPDVSKAADWLLRLQADQDLRQRLGAAGAAEARLRLRGGAAALALAAP